MKRNKFLVLTCLAGLVAAPGLVGAFTPDEFDSSTTGSQWTFFPSPVAKPTTVTINNNGSGQLELEAPEGSDHWFIFDTQAFLQQDAPTGTNWEIITKLDGFDPTRPGEQRQFTRAGMQLWQNDNRFISMTTLSSGDGLFIDSQNLWQFDPQNPAEGGGGSGWLRGSMQLNGYPPQPITSLWIKLQSTSRGYRGFMSTDGFDWLECLSVVKNPDTPDGLMENAKIRLFHAGGFYHGETGGQAGTPAKFDFIRINTIPDPTGVYMDDEFEGTELGANWGTHQGIGVGSIGLNGGDLVITAGPFSNLWSDIEQPTYVYQEAPTATSYTITTKVEPIEMTSVPFEIWNSYGIWLWKDQCNWIFISNNRSDEEFPPGSGIWLDNNRTEAAVKYNNTFHDRAISYNDGATQNPAPAYLRVARDGTMVRVEYSHDNVTWTPFTFDVGGVQTADFPLGSDNMQVRLFSKRVYGDNDHDENNPPLDARFDWIRAEINNSSVGGWELY